MNSSYDSEANAYYFEVDPSALSMQQISLGHREVIADVDMNGKIIGIEII